MKRLLYFLSGAMMLTPLKARSAEISIVDVRRNIQLSEKDPVYRDFYLNAGEGSGLKKNLVVTAMRKVSVRDASGSQSYGEILVPVGKLRIIAVYNKIAIAREFEAVDRENFPMIEQRGFMSGDKIDLSGAYVESSKKRNPQAETLEKTEESGDKSAL